jgi:RNA polymerase sigma factor (sigma-70 family)
VSVLPGPVFQTRQSGDGRERVVETMGAARSHAVGAAGVGRGVLPPFQRVLDEHGPAVHRFLRARVGPDEADDCFQETFLAALAAYPRLAGDANVRGWVMRIAERKAIDAHRARRRRPAPAASLPEQPRPAPELPDTAVWGRVRALPAKQRAAIALRYAGDLAYAEIGEVIGCSEEAARQNVRAGLRRLREVVGP